VTRKGTAPPSVTTTASLASAPSSAGPASTKLPQLINVLRGDMSLVGPRPHALGSLAGDKLFWEINEQYWVRHALKPGITGLAQIRG
jgi:hypothetical protein